MNKTPGRNDPCPCGSGKKYKKCCQDKYPCQPLEQKGKADNLSHKVIDNVPTPEEVNQLAALFTAGRITELESKASLLVEKFPDSVLAWKALGTALFMQGKNTLDAFQKVVELMPVAAEGHNDLGAALQNLGQIESALTSYRRALEINPDYAHAHCNVGVALNILGDPAGAVASFRRALEIKPDYAEALNNLGINLQDLGQLEAAVTSLRRALEIKPDYADAHYNLGNALRDLGQLNNAVTSYHQALRVKPGYAEASNNLGNVLRDLGKLDEAVAHYRLALALAPDYLDAQSNLLYCLSQSESVDAKMLFAEHLRFGERFEVPLRISWTQHANSPDPERCLKIGVVSADFRNHAIASFIEPLLVHLAGYAQLQLHAYSNSRIEDLVSVRLQGYFKSWYPIATLSDIVLAEKIRADNIDILIDLSGHTGNHRLLTFARKPAPVQVSWMGYPGTTGLNAMDYYFADRYFLPQDRFDDQFTEKIVRLPASAPFLPSIEAPPVSMLPALENGYVTFGSFNNPGKIGRSVLKQWAQILCAIPDSRMVIGGMAEEGKYETLIEWFEQEGIDRLRLDFHPRMGMAGYLSLYQQVDICLDTFPYNGGTTTLHALWMGVPTLTCSGNTAAGRTGACILMHAGLEAFIAHTAEDYLQKGIFWASNIVELSNIRNGLRDHFTKSAMGQPAVIAAGVELALRIIWQRWCAGMSPESFEVTL